MNIHNTVQVLFPGFSRNLEKRGSMNLSACAREFHRGSNMELSCKGWVVVGYRSAGNEREPHLQNT